MKTGLPITIAMLLVVAGTSALTVCNAHAIYGGVPDIDDKFDSVVAIGLDGATFCTGTLISEDTVITAAHCLADFGEEVFGDKKYFVENPARLSISKTPGEAASVNQANPFIIDSRVKAATISGKYFQSGFIDAADIASLKLQTRIGYTTKIALLPLDFDFGSLRDASAIAIGFGMTPLNTYAQRNAAEVSIKDVDAYNGLQIITAGDNRSGICSGDSGGPLIISVNGAYYLIGVTSSSFGNGYCDVNAPGLFYSPSSQVIRDELSL